MKMPLSFVVCPLVFKTDGCARCYFRGKSCVLVPLDGHKSCRKNSKAVLIAIKSKASTDMGQQLNSQLIFFNYY